MVTPDALRAFILHGFKQFPSLKMKYNTTMVSIGARGQWFWTHPGIVPGGWKLEAYLQLKPLRHARGKRIVTSLNELWGPKQRRGWRRICENEISLDIFKAEMNVFKTERDALKSERDTFKAERDIFKAEMNVFKTERDNLLLENCGLRRMLINPLYTKHIAGELFIFRVPSEAGHVYQDALQGYRFIFGYCRSLSPLLGIHDLWTLLPPTCFERTFFEKS
ncbi:hypothetical protein TNCV_2010331 [Trichonephila clavipes]|nr:hypothetical protein TNCV_2010331 [Trichonephila clavipes]